MYLCSRQVHGHPDSQQMSHIDKHHSDRQRNPVVEDTVAMVTSRLHVADDVTQAITELNLATGGVDCGQNCLATDDVIHMLSLRRQSLCRGGFRQVCVKRHYNLSVCQIITNTHINDGKKACQLCNKYIENVFILTKSICNTTIYKVLFKCSQPYLKYSTHAEFVKRR